MEKRHRLRLNTPDATLRTLQSDSVVIGRDESRLSIPSVLETSATHDDIGDSASAEEDGRDILPRPRISCDLNVYTAWAWALLRKHTGYLVAIGVLLYVLLRPSDYAPLVQEIHNLKIAEKEKSTRPEPRNISLIHEGTRVTPQTPLYRYGWFSNKTSDPYSILEPNNECLAFAGTHGKLRLTFKRSYRLNRIGIYSPPGANRTASVKDFSISTAEKRWALTYSGLEYQEFLLDDVVADHLTIDVHNNYGDAAYTSLHRIYIFGW